MKQTMTVADLRFALQDLSDDTLIHVRKLDDGYHGGFYTVQSIHSTSKQQLLVFIIEDLAPIE